MKYIILFEDYSDSEIKDLMGDLGGVGLQKKWRVIGRIYTVTPDREYYKNWEVQTHQVFVADVVAETKEDAEGVTGKTCVEYNETTNFASIGGTYNSEKNKFISITPFASWLLNQDSLLWEAPVEYPSDGDIYLWDEASVSWVLFTE
jgi:hypothetical protein